MKTRNERQRYLAFKLVGPTTLFTIDEIKQVIWDSIHELFGVKGASESGLYVKSFDPKPGIGIIRYSHLFCDQLEASLARITKINNLPIQLVTLLRSGTLASLHKKLQNKRLNT